MNTTWKSRLLRTSALSAVAFAAGTLLVFGAPDALRAATPLSPPAEKAFQAVPNFADVTEAVAPAVVNIQVTHKVSAQTADARTGGPSLPEGLRRFFGDSPNQPFGSQQPESNAPQRVQGLGSGFIVSADGYIVTNDHVAGDAEKIVVILQDGREFIAQRIGRDPKTDLALLKIDGVHLPFVKFADATPRVGEWVIAVGSPFGLGNTVTAGIVSAHGRSLGPNGPYDGFMQIDAAINRGNSGGPAFNLRVEVVGVNTAIFSPSGGNVGIGFAVPAETAKAVIAQLQITGTVQRGWLGVSIQAVTPDIAESLGFEKPHGALVSNVSPDSPAQRAGLASGDVVVAVDSTPIDSVRDLPKAIGTMAPETATKLTILRGGHERAISVTVGSSPDTIAPAEPSQSDQVEQHLGMALSSLDPAMRQTFGIGESVAGVIVTDVDPDGPAFTKGVRAGDVIVSVGNDAVLRPNDVSLGIERARVRQRKAVLIQISRGGQEQYIAVPFGVA
ncbi:MAG: DegQ family serine endoprotease [Alphaproteobacteria bacterium]|nr:DegQ family serine endoprotease [Alphaproteobacteria bacterium]